MPIAYGAALRVRERPRYRDRRGPLNRTSATVPARCLEFESPVKCHPLPATIRREPPLYLASGRRVLPRSPRPEERGVLAACHCAQLRLQPPATEIYPPLPDDP